MEIRRNGTTQVNLNTLISIAGIVFIAGGGWVKLNALGEKFQDQGERMEIVIEQLATVKEKVAQLEDKVGRQTRVIRDQGNEDRRWRNRKRGR
jgi:hypothetical protein